MKKFVSFVKSNHYIFLLLLLLCAFFYQLFMHPSYIPYSDMSDLVTQFARWKVFTSDAILNFGQVPLWVPSSFSGVPFALNAHASVFYPFYALNILFDADSVFGWQYFIHLFLAGLFTYMFMRELRAGRYASFIASIIYAFSGTLIIQIFAGHIFELAKMAWFPLVLLLVERIIRKRSFVYSALLGIALTMQVLTAHPQIFLYSATAAAIYSVLRLLFEFRKHKSLSGLSKPVVLFVTAFIVWFLLSAVQVLPNAQLSQLFIRAGGVDYAFASLGSLTFAQLITVFLPTFFGTPATHTYWGARNFMDLSIYTGVVSLVLAWLALFFIRKKHVIIIALMGLFALLYALGPGTPLHYMFYRFVPFFELFRVPGRILFVFAFSVAALAGFGADYLLNNHELKRVLLKKLFIILLVLSVVALIFSSALFFFKPFVLEKAQQVVAQRYNAGLLPETISPGYYAEKLSVVFSEVMKNLLVFSSVLGLFSLSVLLFLMKRIDLRFLKPAIVIFVIADLWIFGLPHTEFKDPEAVYAETGLAAMFKDSAPYYRIHDSSGILTEDPALRAGAAIIVGGDSTQLTYYVDLINLIGNFTTDQYRGDSDVEDLGINDITNYRILDLLNVKYFISDEKTNASQFELLSEGNETVHNFAGTGTESEVIHFYVYENMDVLPRAFVVGKAKVIFGREEILAELSSEEFNPGEYVVLEKDIGKPLITGHKFKKADIVFYSPNKASIDVSLDGSGFLVLSDTWYPGWKAFDNGREVEVYKADYALRAVYLEEGQHRVDFVFDPAAFKAGWIISLLSFIALLAYFFVKRNSLNF